MEWNNADSYESWKKLMSLKGQVSLKKELNADRVKITLQKWQLVLHITMPQNK